MLIQKQFGIIQNLQTPPILQTSFLPWTFTVSYTKTDLDNRVTIIAKIMFKNVKRTSFLMFTRTHPALKFCSFSCISIYALLFFNLICFRTFPINFIPTQKKICDTEKLMKVQFTTSFSRPLDMDVTSSSGLGRDSTPPPLAPSSGGAPHSTSSIASASAASMSNDRPPRYQQVGYGFANSGVQNYLA